MDKEVNSFREELDKDSGLQSKRKALVVTSSILIAIFWTGATVKELTGLLATIEVKDMEAFKYLLVAAVLYQLIRYYGYAQKYHVRLRSFWVDKFMSDPTVFRFDIEKEDIDGLIGRAIQVYVPDCPGIVSARYINKWSLKHPFLGRQLVYEENASSQVSEDEFEDYTYDEYIDLTLWHEEWNRKNYAKLLCIEFRYKWAYRLSSREYLDLVAAYAFALIAITPYTLLPIWNHFWLWLN